MPKKKSPSATSFCKVCFRDLGKDNLLLLGRATLPLCQRCYSEMNPVFRRWVTSGVRFTAIYPYEDVLRSLIFQFKGCGDVELAPVFLAYPLTLLRLRYRRYVVVPAPSHEEDDCVRGFNHVQEMFASLGLPIVKAIRKTGKRKQSDCSAEERTHIGNFLALDSQTDLKGKNVLFVDDVYTTGSTARACIALLRKAGVKKVEGLVIARTPKKEK